MTVDLAGDVVLDGCGMSVAPGWRVLDDTRVPKRLRAIRPGAIGPNSLACYTLGVGPFLRGIVASGLELFPDHDIDPVKHGVVAPLLVVPIAQYLIDLADTRAAWQIDET